MLSTENLCAGKHPACCPKPSPVEAVLKQVEQREKREVYTHILFVPRVNNQTAAIHQLIEGLKTRGYRFVTSTEYMNLVAPKRPCA